VALVVFDASVVIALLDEADTHHASAMNAFRGYAGDDLRLPVSAYSETLVVPGRKGRLNDARREIGSFLLHIEPISEVMAEQAATLRVRHRGLRLPDALVLACAASIQADVLLTADLRWKGLMSSVCVV
jgi:predicted nucleic acid-binding protein